MMIVTGKRKIVKENHLCLHLSCISVSHQASVIAVEATGGGGLRCVVVCCVAAPSTRGRGCSEVLGKGTEGAGQVRGAVGGA